MFKVHQALALCNDFDNKGISLDTLVNINRDKLDPKTWSPMLKDYSGPVISLTVRDLLRYTLTPVSYTHLGYAGPPDLYSSGNDN